MKTLNSQKLRRMADVFLALPFIVILTVIAIYFEFWRTDPLLRFIHMIWVLGFWMVGTLALFAFIIPAQLKHHTPFLKLILSIFAIFLVVYFTPLQRFTAQFITPAGLTFPAVVGILNVTISWLAAFRFRNKIAT